MNGVNEPVIIVVQEKETRLDKAIKNLKLISAVLGIYFTITKIKNIANKKVNHVVFTAQVNKDNQKGE